MKNLFIAAGMTAALFLAHMMPALIPNWLGFILLVGFMLGLPIAGMVAVRKWMNK